MYSRKSRPLIPPVTETLAIALVYFALARAGQIFAIEPGNVTPVWPASGFALAVVLWCGQRTWLGLWLGVILGNTWAILDVSSLGNALRTAATGIAIGPGAICQAFVGAYLVRRFCSGMEAFERIRDVFNFVGTQAVACLFSATLGTLTLCIGGVANWQSYGYTWLTWYLGDGVGIILFAPLLLTLHAIRPAFRDGKRIPEAATILLLSVVVSLLVFNDLFQSSLIFLPLPLVLWAAVRGDQFAVSVTVFVIALIAIWGTSQGRGPFVTEDTNVSLLILQLYAATTAVTGSAVAAALFERRSAVDELSRIASRLDQALRGANVGLWDWDVPSNHVYCSPQFKIQLGYDPEEPWHTYHAWESRLHPDDKVAAVQRVRDYLEGRSSEYVSTFRLQHKDGSYLWFLSRGEAEWDEQHKPLRMIGVHVDVTDNTRHAKELERANLELQQMAHAASHDLLEPLRTISSFSQLVERQYQGQLDEEGRSWLEAIVQGTKRMRMLIEDLRAYTQLDGHTHAFVATNMNEVLAGAIAGLQSSIQESGAEVTHDHLPSVMGDRSELTQLFQNLIGNAIKYCGEAAPRVHVSAKRYAENYVFSVRDNGVGIAAEYRERIFEVFRRLHHAHDYPGTGIGLAICRRVVQRHRGQIWVESEVGRGSTFRLTIPIQQTEDPP